MTRLLIFNADGVEERDYATFQKIPKKIVEDDEAKRTRKEKSKQKIKKPKR